MNKKKVYTKAFAWGRREHKFEGLTNWALLITIIFFWFALYRQSWCLVKVSFYMIVVSFFIHLLARLCHRIEKRYHEKAHN